MCVCLLYVILLLCCCTQSTCNKVHTAMGTFYDTESVLTKWSEIHVSEGISFPLYESSEKKESYEKSR